MSKQYYILSLKHTRGDFILWWQPRDSGYTNNLNVAGLYDEDDVLRRASYLNNGHTTWAILKENVEAVMSRTVSTDVLTALCGQPMFQTDCGVMTKMAYDKHVDEELRNNCEED